MQLHCITVTSQSHEKKLSEKRLPLKNTETKIEKKEISMTEKPSWCVIFRHHNTRETNKNLVKVFFVKSGYASDCKSNKIREGAKKRIIADHKPIKQPRQGTCYIRLMSKDHKQPMHLLKTCRIQYGPINSEPLWRASVCTHFEPNIASISKFHTFNLFQTSFRKHFIF